MKLSAFRPAAQAIALLLLMGPLLVLARPNGEAEANSPVLQRIRTSQVVRVIHDESVPFSYRDANQRSVGYSIDLCQSVVEALRRDMRLPGLRAEHVMVGTDERVKAIASGQADLECGAATNNAERRKQVAFSMTHFFTGARLLVRTSSGVKKLSDLNGKRIATLAETTVAEQLKWQNSVGLTRNSVVIARSDEHAFALLQKGEVEAYAMDDILLYALRAGSKTPDEWAIVGEFMSFDPLAVMLPKDPAFKRLVDRAIAAAMLDGHVERLYRKWFEAGIPPSGVKLSVPMNSQLREQLRYPTDKVGDEFGA